MLNNLEFSEVKIQPQENYFNTVKKFPRFPLLRYKTLQAPTMK